MSPVQINQFQKHILAWYAKNKRDLPWRDPSLLLENGKRDPYAIFVSEVMAQQTQLNRVIPKYLLWMKEFPTLEALASATLVRVRLQ
jgi:A/G-specific adenine glycosylase